MLRVIAMLKFAQSLALVLFSAAALQLLRPDVAQLVRTWVQQAPLESERNLVHHAGTWVSTLLPHQVAGIGIGALLYGILFAVEGVGLWRRRIWAEWLTVAATGALIPLELWEVGHRRSPLGVLVLTVNVAVVWYLVRQLRQNKALREAALRQTHSAAPPDGDATDATSPAASPAPRTRSA